MIGMEKMVTAFIEIAGVPVELDAIPVSGKTEEDVRNEINEFIIANTSFTFEIDGADEEE